MNRLDPLVAGVCGVLKGLECADLDHRDLVAREAVVGQQLTNLKLNKLEKLFVIHHVAFVHCDNDGRHVHLTSKQDVLTGLRHRAVRRCDH